MEGKEEDLATAAAPGTEWMTMFYYPTPDMIPHLIMLHWYSEDATAGIQAEWSGEGGSRFHFNHYPVEDDKSFYISEWKFWGLYYRNLDMELSWVSNTTEYLKYLDMELQYSKYV